MTIDPGTGYPFPNQMSAVWAGDNVAQADTFIRYMDATIRENYSRTILVNSLHYLDSLISGQENFLSFVSFRAYSAKLNPFIAVLQTAAAQNQVAVFGKILTTWKAMFKEADWDKLYVVVSVIWPLT